MLDALGDARAPWAVYALRQSLNDLPPPRVIEVMRRAAREGNGRERNDAVGPTATHRGKVSESVADGIEEADLQGVRAMSWTSLPSRSARASRRVADGPFRRVPIL